MKTSQKRLFLPLTTEAFTWYSQGKTIEIRKEQKRFKNIFQYQNGLAELRKGYNGTSLWADIVKIKKYDTINDLIIEVDYKKIIPDSQSQLEAVNKMTNYIGKKEGIIAIFFESISIIKR